MDRSGLILLLALALTTSLVHSTYSQDNIKEETVLDETINNKFDTFTDNDVDNGLLRNPEASENDNVDDGLSSSVSKTDESDITLDSDQESDLPLEEKDKDELEDYVENLENQAELQDYLDELEEDDTSREEGDSNIPNFDEPVGEETDYIFSIPTAGTDDKSAAGFENREDEAVAADEDEDDDAPVFEEVSIEEDEDEAVTAAMNDDDDTAGTNEDESDVAPVFDDTDEEGTSPVDQEEISIEENEDEAAGTAAMNDDDNTGVIDEDESDVAPVFDNTDEEGTSPVDQEEVFIEEDEDEAAGTASMNNDDNTAVTDEDESDVAPVFDDTDEEATSPVDQEDVSIEKDEDEAAGTAAMNGDDDTAVADEDESDVAPVFDDTDEEAADPEEVSIDEDEAVTAAMNDDDNTAVTAKDESDIDEEITSTVDLDEKPVNNGMDEEESIVAMNREDDGAIAIMDDTNKETDVVDEGLEDSMSESNSVTNRPPGEEKERVGDLDDKDSIIEEDGTTSSDNEENQEIAAMYTTETSWGRASNEMNHETTAYHTPDNDNHLQTENNHPIHEVESDIPGGIDGLGHFYEKEYDAFIEKNLNEDDGFGSYNTITYFMIMVLVALSLYVMYSYRNSLFLSGGRRSTGSQNYAYSRLGDSQDRQPLV